MNTIEIIDAVEARRREIDMTVSELSRRTGISRTSYLRIVQRGTISSVQLEKLALALQTDVRSLVKDSGPTAPPDEITVRRVRDLLGRGGLEEPKWLHDAIELLWRSHFIPPRRATAD